MEEARRLLDDFLAGRARLLPVKLDDARPPELLSTLQYKRVSQRTPTEIVDHLVSGSSHDGRERRTGVLTAEIGSVYQ